MHVYEVCTLNTLYSLCGPILHSYSCPFSWAVKSGLWTRPVRVSHSCSKADIGCWCVFVGECTCVGEHGCAQVCVYQMRVYRRRRGFDVWGERYLSGSFAETSQESIRLAVGVRHYFSVLHLHTCLDTFLARGNSFSFHNVTGTRC